MASNHPTADEAHRAAPERLPEVGRATLPGTPREPTRRGMHIVRARMMCDGTRPDCPAD